MQSSKVLKAAGLVLAAVVLGLLTVQGSYALWNTMVPSSAGTVQAADFRVTMTGTQTGNSTDMTSAAGTAASITLSTSSPSGALTPGKSVYAGVQLGNASNAGGVFTIRASVAAPISQNSALSPYVSVKSATAATLAQCSEPARYTSINTGKLPILDIAKAATGVFCFQVTLAATTPANLSGQTAQITVPVLVNQLPAN